MVFDMQITINNVVYIPFKKQCDEQQFDDKTFIVTLYNLILL